MSSRVPGSQLAHSALSAVALAMAAACSDSADVLTPRGDARPAEGAPAPAAPPVASVAPFGRAEVRVHRAGQTADLVAEGPLLQGRIGRSGSGGYTDDTGRVVEWRDSAFVAATQFAGFSASTGESFSLNVAGTPPKPGQYAVIPSGVRPPWDVARSFGVSYAVGGCNHVYVAQHGTLTATARAGGGMELAFDVTARAVPLFVFDPSTGFTCRGGARPAVDQVRLTGRLLL